MTLEELFKAAFDGPQEAQYVIGLCYENGWGIEADKNVAKTWLLKCAQNGFAAAQYELSLLLQAHGKDDLAEAIDWLRKSALQGFPLAEYLYSLYCEQGIGVAPNLTEAFQFCLLAATRGYCPATRRTASMLEQGIGVAINLEQAFEWYRRAAELGDIDSAASVGKMYANGTGVEKNEAEALQWLQEGQRRGSPWAFLRLSSVYRFGELGQPIDTKKADDLALQGQRLIEARADRGTG